MKSSRIASLVMSLTVMGSTQAIAQQCVYCSAAYSFGQLYFNGETDRATTARSQGWYRSDGLSNSPSEAYRPYSVGRGLFNDPESLAYGFRSFFAFDIPNITVLDATFLIYSQTTVGAPALTVNFRDFIGSPQSLWQGTGGVEAYNDLGAGVLYGSRVYSLYENAWTYISLNAAAIADIQAAAGSQWVLSASLDEEALPPTTAPEPGTLALVVTGLAGLAAARRRRGGSG